jgi:hypothetical protein
VSPLGNLAWVELVRGLSVFTVRKARQFCAK